MILIADSGSTKTDWCVVENGVLLQQIFTKGTNPFFQSEEEDYLRIADELGICRNPEDANKFVRYPLVYLVEAADDICYQIMDIEDACKLHILTTEEAIQLLLNFFEGERLERIIKVMKMVDDTNEQIAYLRSCIIGLLVDECSRVFLENEEGILTGTYNTPLIEQISTKAKEAYETCSKTAYKKIYRAKEVARHRTGRLPYLQPFDRYADRSCHEPGSMPTVSSYCNASRNSTTQTHRPSTAKYNASSIISPA